MTKNILGLDLGNQFNFTLSNFNFEDVKGS